MRKYYLDNLRTIMILLLFPVHTFMIWNNYGGKFYIWGGENKLLSSLIVIVNPWFMALLFVIAGMCARYSLEKRDTKKFIKERVSKLLVPFICGIILLVPIQTLYARKFFYGYNGSILDNYKYFFTHYTDLSGYDGSFTPGHLWFILFLFIISLLALLIIKYIPYKKVSAKFEKANIFIIILLFIPVWLMYYIGNFGGYSIGKYFILFLLGYYMFSNEKIIDKIVENRRVVLGLFCLFQLMLVIGYYNFSYYEDFFVNFVGWMGILSCIIIGKLYLNKENKVTNYFKKASFSIYILHQTILVIIGYYSLTMIDNIFLQICMILFGSFVVTILFYEIISKIPILKKIIGVR